MSGLRCSDPLHRPKWDVTQRKSNRSAFSGYRPTSSDYSEVRCPVCRKMWRTKAAYVSGLPNAPANWWEN